MNRRICFDIHDTEHYVTNVLQCFFDVISKQRLFVLRLCQSSEASSCYALLVTSSFEVLAANEPSDDLYGFFLGGGGKSILGRFSREMPDIN
jgi:hypothetical protein